MTDQRQMLAIPSERKVQVDVRVWFGAKLAIWRCKVAADIIVKRAAEIVARCRHAEGCHGAAEEFEPCLPGCLDRETRMDALVVLNAARQSAPVSASKLADQPYMPPSREYFSAIVAELAACQAELEVLRGSVVTAPPETDPPQIQEKPA
jgi:hypothetical protein